MNFSYESHVLAAFITYMLLEKAAKTTFVRKIRAKTLMKLTLGLLLMYVLDEDKMVWSKNNESDQLDWETNNGEN